MRTSTPAATDSSASRRSTTCWIQRMPASWARAIRSAGTTMWKEIAAGVASSVASNAASSNGRLVWLTANGRSVSSRSRAHWARSSGTLRRPVPRLAMAPRPNSAAAGSTRPHGPNGAPMIGVSMPSSPQRGVRSTPRSSATAPGASTGDGRGAARVLLGALDQLVRRLLLRDEAGLHAEVDRLRVVGDDRHRRLLGLDRVAARQRQADPLGAQQAEDLRVLGLVGAGGVAPGPAAALVGADTE